MREPNTYPSAARLTHRGRPLMNAREILNPYHREWTDQDVRQARIWEDNLDRRATTRFPFGSAEWIAFKQIAHLTRISRHGLAACYRNVEEWLFDFYANFSWGPQRTEEIRLMLDNQAFDQINAAFLGKIGYDMRQELEKALKSDEEQNSQAADKENGTPPETPSNPGSPTGDQSVCVTAPLALWDLALEAIQVQIEALEDYSQRDSIEEELLQDYLKLRMAIRAAIG